MMETKKVTLPSGRTVEIKRPGIRALKAVYGSMPMLSPQAEAKDDDPLRNLEMAARMCCLCSVEPKFSDADDVPEGQTDLDELSIEDFSALAAEINEFSGLMEAKEKMRPFSLTESASVSST